MNQIHENLVVLNYGDELPPDMAEFYFKIYLAGTIDLGMTGSNDWQGKFINGMTNLCDPQNGELMFRDKKFIVINPRAPMSNPVPSVDNQEFMQKYMWTQGMIAAADGVFLNFLKKSEAIAPMLDLASLQDSQKMVVRCSEEYIHFPWIYAICKTKGIPMLSGRMGNVFGALQTMFSYIPKFREVNDYGLPE